MKRIGIFSGTFDPVHEGHLAFAEAARSQCQLDEVVLLPEPQPRGKQDVTSLEHRVAMLQQSVTNREGLRVLTLPSQQFSVAETLPQLRELFRDAEIIILMGSDVARSLPHWERVAELLREVSLAIGLRGPDQPADLKPILRKLEQTHHITIRHCFIQTPHPHLTSSQIRHGQSKGLPQTTTYAQTHNLYGRV